MRLNWGKSIVIAFALFMSFILYFVIKVQTNPDYDNELVVEEYYKRDTKFSDEMAKQQNAAELKNQVVVTASANGVAITFPAEFEPGKLAGTVSMYRPSSKKLDFQKDLKLQDATMLIPKAQLAGGRWNVTVAWSYGGNAFVKKETIYVN